MQDAAVIQSIRRKFDDLADDLDERGRRRWAAGKSKKGKPKKVSDTLKSG